ncbi:hypothetical protein GLOIN_2v1845950 [Rhizophagus clarus]|uniref:HAT C-terminal dimerisation domain-containing protein n=1 Tax=Rhizophagus clarus TaxID=94130 RepID=A0A8H3QH99_9GLOM|nr:hypothetical protein GLOIN_2v1845950 [Rhizophagus clarus]
MIVNLKMNVRLAFSHILRFSWPRYTIRPPLNYQDFAYDCQKVDTNTKIKILTFNNLLIWWETIQNAYELQALALQPFVITPHSTFYERSFSILGWFYEQKLHNLNITTDVELESQIFNIEQEYEDDQNISQKVQAVVLSPQHDDFDIEALVKELMNFDIFLYV